MGPGSAYNIALWRNSREDTNMRETSPGDETQSLLRFRRSILELARSIFVIETDSR